MPQPRKMRVTPVVFNILCAADTPLRVSEIVSRTKSKRCSVGYALGALQQQGRVTKLGMGMYTVASRAAPEDPRSPQQRLLAILRTLGPSRMTAPRVLAEMYAKRFGEPINPQTLCFSLAALRRERWITRPRPARYSVPADGGRAPFGA